MGSTRSLGLCLAAQLLGPSAPGVRRVTALLAAGPARCPQPVPCSEQGSCQQWTRVAVVLPGQVPLGWRCFHLCDLS